MGVDVRLKLFDLDAYARLLEAHQRWEASRDAGPIVEVLRETLAKVRAHAPARAAIRERQCELDRRAKSLPPAAVDEGAWAKLAARLMELQRQAMEAAHRGDVAAWTQLILAQQGVRFPGTDDPVRQELAAEGVSLLLDPPGPQDIEEADLVDAIAVLTAPASSTSKRKEVLSQLTVPLVDAYSLAWDREPRADVGVGRGELARWFSDHSAYLANIVTAEGASGRFLELAEATRLFTPDDLVRFRAELDGMREPESPTLAERIGRVRRLVDLALAGPGLALAVSIA